MARHLSKLKTGTCYHGHAGMASAFAALAQRTLALVLPLTASAASSWQAFRQMMAQHFTDLMVLSIAANGREMSFSSDTGMAECLVIARKMLIGTSPVGTLPTMGNQEQQGNYDGCPTCDGRISHRCAIGRGGLPTLGGAKVAVTFTAAEIGRSMRAVVSTEVTAELTALLAYASAEVVRIAPGRAGHGPQQGGNGNCGLPVRPAYGGAGTRLRQRHTE